MLVFIQSLNGISVYGDMFNTPVLIGEIRKRKDSFNEWFFSPSLVKRWEYSYNDLRQIEMKISRMSEVLV